MNFTKNIHKILTLTLKTGKIFYLLNVIFNNEGVIKSFN